MDAASWSLASSSLGICSSSSSAVAWAWERLLNPGTSWPSVLLWARDLGTHRFGQSTLLSIRIDRWNEPSDSVDHRRLTSTTADARGTVDSTDPAFFMACSTPTAARSSAHAKTRWKERVERNDGWTELGVPDMPKIFFCWHVGWHTSFWNVGARLSLSITYKKIKCMLKTSNMFDIRTGLFEHLQEFAQQN